MSQILLIEPDRNLAGLIAKLLKHQDHEVTRATDAQKAITAVDQTKPDIVILELKLPVHNGIEFLYELKSYADWQDIPVIIYSQVPDGIKAVGPNRWDQFGVVAYHYKPVTKLTDLSNSVDQVLAKVA